MFRKVTSKKPTIIIKPPNKLHFRSGHDRSSRVQRMVEGIMLRRYWTEIRGVEGLRRTFIHCDSTRRKTTMVDVDLLWCVTSSKNHCGARYREDNEIEKAREGVNSICCQDDSVGDTVIGEG